MIDIAKLREIKRTNAIQKEIDKNHELMHNAIINRTKEFEKLIDQSLITAAEHNKTKVDIKFNINSLENLKAFMNIMSMYQNDFRCAPIEVDEEIENKFNYEYDLNSRVLFFMFDFASIIFENKNIELLINLFKDKEKFKNSYKNYTKFATNSIVIRFDFAERY